jgi:hypothetical protein
MKISDIYATFDDYDTDDELKHEDQSVPPDQSFLNYQRAGSGEDISSGIDDKTQSVTKGRVNKQQFDAQHIPITDDEIDRLDTAANGVTDSTTLKQLLKHPRYDL